MTTHKKGKKRKKEKSHLQHPHSEKTILEITFSEHKFFFFLILQENEHPCHTYGMEDEDFAANTMRLYQHTCCLEHTRSQSRLEEQQHARQSWSKSFRPAILQRTTPVSIQPRVERRKPLAETRLLLLPFNDIHRGNRS